MPKLDAAAYDDGQKQFTAGTSLRSIIEAPTGEAEDVQAEAISRIAGWLDKLADRVRRGDQ